MKQMPGKHFLVAHDGFFFFIHILITYNWYMHSSLLAFLHIGIAFQMCQLSFNCAFMMPDAVLNATSCSSRQILMRNVDRVKGLISLMAKKKKWCCVTRPPLLHPEWHLIQDSCILLCDLGSASDMLQLSVSPHSFFFSVQLPFINIAL